MPDPFNGGSRDYYQNIHTFLTDFYQETTLSYAWEHDSLQPTIDVVRHRVLDTEELVIIGYSLPRFNAIVDAEILRAMPNLKPVPDSLENLKIEESELIDFALTIGSDVPYCLYNEKCVVKGVGEIIGVIKDDIADMVGLPHGINLYGKRLFF